MRAWFPKQTLPPKLSSSDFRPPPFLTIYVYADFVLWTCSNFCRLFRYWRKIRNFFIDMIYCETTSFHINTDFIVRRYTKLAKTFSCNVSWSSTLASTKSGQNHRTLTYKYLNKSVRMTSQGATTQGLCVWQMKPVGKPLNCLGGGLVQPRPTISGPPRYDFNLGNSTL